MTSEIERGYKALYEDTLEINRQHHRLLGELQRKTDILDTLLAALDRCAEEGHLDKYLEHFRVAAHEELEEASRELSDLPEPGGAASLPSMR
jgi:hypothetical protein